MSSDTTSFFSQDKINSPKLNGDAIYEFNDFRLDASRRMLYRNDEPVLLAPKVVETLIVLIENRGEVISKNELMERVWADSIVEESNLTQNIYLLRKTLGSNSEGKPLIETFRRRGYRFNCIVEDAQTINNFSENEINEQSNAAETKVVAPEKLSAPSGNARKSIFFALAAFALLAAILVIAPLFFNRLGRTTESPAYSFKRLTPDIYAYNPTISPDGKYLAYAEIKDGKTDVWIKDINLGSAVRLLPPTALGYKGLQFSPDGDELYFLTQRENIPNHVIARVAISGDRTPRDVVGNAISPAAVSPDNSRLAFINGQGELTLINADGSGERLLRRRESGRWFNGWDAEMSFSPDGEKIAVCGGFLDGGKSFSELVEISVADATERQIPIPPNWREISGVVWLSDGETLLATVRESHGQPVQIWNLSYSGGAAKRITNDLNDYHYISASQDGSRIVAEQSFGNLNIWAADSTKIENVEQITFGRAAKDGYFGIAYLPDGKIVYSSIRSGNIDLWMTDSDGANQQQLTADAGTLNARPQTAADGRYIVFVSSRSGVNRIWRMDADGGNVKQLTFGDNIETRPHLSPDGAWVFYTSGEGSDKSFIWKVPIEGGEPIRVSNHNLSWGAVVSPNGKLIAYNHNEPKAAQPWKVGVMNAAGGSPFKLFDLSVYGGILSWSADSKSILFIRGEDPNIWQQSIEGGEPRRLTNFKSERTVYFAFSPDRRRIALARGSLTTEAVLIDSIQ